MEFLGPEEWQAVMLSLKVAFWATLASLPVGIGTALLLARGRFPGRQMLNVLVHLPLILPPVVTGYLLLLTFGRRGPLGGLLEQWFGIVLAFRWTGAALAAAIMAFPLMVRAIRLAIEAVDPRLEQAAATLGAPRWKVFATVTLPLIAPGVIAGAVLAFAKAMGEFGATITFVSNIPGADAHGAHRDLCVPAGAGWRGGGIAAGLGLGGHRDAGPDGIGMAGPPRRAQDRRAMSLSVDIRHAMGAFRLNVTFEAPDGVTVLFGRSGSGKTSVVNAVAGLLTPDEGRIVLEGRVLFDSAARRSVPVHRRRLGYVFQEGRLFPHLTVRENLLYADRVAGNGAAAGLDRVVDMLGVAHLLNRRPGALSGGEAQRVAIGRALLSDPVMLLMDEPLAALDGARKAEILPYLERLRTEAGVPILYVSHNVSEVARLATHVVVLEDGAVVKAGAAGAMLADPEVARIMGVRDAGAVLQARVLHHSGDGLTELEFSGGILCLPEVEAPVGSDLRVRILAQDVMLAIEAPRGISALNILPVTVLALRRGQGPGVMVQLRAGSDTLLARITRRSADALALREGSACFAVLKSVAVAHIDIGAGLQS